MSLRNAPLLYVFFEAAHVERQRRFLESDLGFPVIEVEPHQPHHRHGVVKYDAGGVILSLNLTDHNRFLRETTDALVSVVDVATDLPTARLESAKDGFVSKRGTGLVDLHGHHFDLIPRLAAGAAPQVTAFRLVTDDLPATARFYRDVLDMELLNEDAGSSTFRAGGVDVVLESRTRASSDQTRHDTFLIVFYTPDVAAAQRELAARGASFKKPKPGYSEIGGSTRFEDPAGNHLCLYEPSAECLTWGSGPKVMEIAQIQGEANARRLPDSVPVPVRD